uniref:Salivary OBP n=1 Tax=Cimex lectularius TaxID=79782 RepID=D1FPL4_CIMLE
MKGLLLVFAVLATSCYASVIDKQFSDKIRQGWENCKNLVDDATYTKLTEKWEPATTYNEKCFKKCTSEQMGYMTGNTVNKQTLLEANPHQWPDTQELPLANEMINECYDETVGKQTDPCLTAGDFCDCMRKKITEKKLSFPQMYPEA